MESFVSGNNKIDAIIILLPVSMNKDVLEIAVKPP